MYRFLVVFFIGFCQSSSSPDGTERWNSIIQEVNAANGVWKAGYNFDPQVTTESLKRLCGSKIRDDWIGKTPSKSEEDYIPINEIPESFDARDNWKNCHNIGHVHDQGNCGSCWAVSLTSVMTDRVCIFSKAKIRTTIAAEDLLSCCNECGFGCGGGCLCCSWDHVTRVGISSGGDYGSHSGCKPYTIPPCEHHINGSLPRCNPDNEVDTPLCHQRCTNRQYERSYWRDQRKFKKWYHVNATVEEIQKEIMTHGPVQVAFTVYEDFFTYKSGVYHYITGKKVGGHAVKIIGWGIQQRTPYWLIVNSWNTHWGENGLFKIVRGKDECNIEHGVFAGIPHSNH
ncbi:cathepsin B-like [Lycorma delicatula]|uniref:cathepsin B-like n=1 Tax=Lycorma delicatula TaxID=130591 RepID=UPI003F50DBAC